MPVFRLLYPSIKMLIDSFSPERRGSFKAVVLVQHPREGTWAFAFVTSELKTAFQIGFTVFIPFLIIDLVVASVLMSMGMMMLSPVLISLPFKLMLFVLVDGWTLLIGSLVGSFHT